MQQKRKLRNLSSNRVTRIGDIPGKVLKADIDICLKDLTVFISHCLEKGVFPNELILA